MPRASTKVFKKRRGVFNKGRCNKSNDGCGESNSTVPKNSADEKNCADGAKSFVLMKLNHLPATRETCEHSMAEAVREAVDENDGKRDLAVAVDGSWQKRGFSSKNGLVTVTSVDTGKVIDVEVFFKTLYLSEQNQASSKLNFEKMCIEPGDYTVQAMECLDKQRLLRAKYYCLQKTKEVRKEKRLKRKKDDELLKNADDLEYGAGMF
ncbi:hypothetical protein TNCV_3587241 [Trichonephila clavipes]|nr:hypothetical protein TNCV_3587241 [Trichonephila clavipes]